MPAVSEFLIGVSVLSFVVGFVMVVSGALRRRPSAAGVRLIVTPFGLVQLAMAFVVIGVAEWS